jgi:YVTN family beta-propeller protein
LLFQTDDLISGPVPEIEAGRGPIQVYATPDGHYVYVANQGTTEEPDEIVSIIGTAERKVVDTVRTGKGAHGVVVCCDGRLAFVTNTFENSLAVIDTDLRKVVKVFSVGQGPNGVTYGKKNEAAVFKVSFSHYCSRP